MTLSSCILSLKECEHSAHPVVDMRSIAVTEALDLFNADITVDKKALNT